MSNVTPPGPAGNERDTVKLNDVVPALPSLALTSLTESAGVDVPVHGFSVVAVLRGVGGRGGEVRRVVVRLRAALSAAQRGGRAGERRSGTGTFEEVGVAVADEVDDLGQLGGVARLPSAAVACKDAVVLASATLPAPAAIAIGVGSHIRRWEARSDLAMHRAR